MINGSIEADRAQAGQPGGMGWPRHQNNDKIALRQGCSWGFSVKL